MTMTQMQAARAGKITDEMKIVAQEEKMDINVLKERVANGTIAICANINHKNLHPYGVGEGLCTKVNANIGTSSAFPDPEPEIEKLNIAIAAGAHSVMDLSTGQQYRRFPPRHFGQFHRHGRHSADLSGNRYSH